MWRASGYLSSTADIASTKAITLALQPQCVWLERQMNHMCLNKDAENDHKCAPLEMDRIRACRTSYQYQLIAAASESAPQVIPPVHAVERPPPTPRNHHEHPSPPLSWPSPPSPLPFGLLPRHHCSINNLPSVPLIAIASAALIKLRAQQMKAWGDVTESQEAVVIVARFPLPEKNRPCFIPPPKCFLIVYVQEGNLELQVRANFQLDHKWK